MLKLRTDFGCRLRMLLLDTAAGPSTFAEWTTVNVWQPQTKNLPVDVLLYCRCTAVYVARGESDASDCYLVRGVISLEEL